MAKRMRALTRDKITPRKKLLVCRCPEAEDGEHECPVIEAQEQRYYTKRQYMIKNYHLRYDLVSIRPKNFYPY